MKAAHNSHSEQANLTCIHTHIDDRDCLAPVEFVYDVVDIYNHLFSHNAVRVLNWIG